MRVIASLSILSYYVIILVTKIILILQHVQVILAVFENFIPLLIRVQKAVWKEDSTGLRQGK
jgi:hypothetical protein